MKEVKFFKASKCETLVVELVEGCKGLECCGEKMIELKANTVDAAVEKHVPEVKREGNIVEVVVGSVLHPMEEDHYITNIVLVQGEKFQIANLEPGKEPKAKFLVEDGKVEVYEYCNKHGLWKTEA